MVWWQVWWLCMHRLRQFALCRWTQSVYKNKIHQKTHPNQHRSIRNAVFLPQFRTIIHHSLIWSMGYFLRRNPMWTVKKLRPIHSGKDARIRLERWGARWRDAWNEREIGQSLSRHKRGRKSGGGERVPHVERRGEMVTWSHWTISLLQLMNPYQDHEIKMERRSARSLQSLGVN